jgi:Domain of unknown function (DUF4192)
MTDETLSRSSRRTVRRPVRRPVRRTVRATGPADLLALVPGFLGFHPEQSVVVLTIGDARQPLHARVDLPADAAAAAGLAAYLARVLEDNGVGHVAVVVYATDRDLTRAVVDALDDELTRRRVELVCVVRADGERWWVLDTRGERRGDRYDVGTHPLTAQAVVEGTVVLGSRQALADSLVGNDPGEAEEVSAGVAAETARLARVLAAPLGEAAARHGLGSEARWVSSRIRRFLDDGMRLASGDVARLVTVMAVSAEVRDVALTELTCADAERHVDLWRDVLRRTPVDLRAAPAALLGLSAWLSGKGALAWCAVECALESDPGYRLADLLARALVAAVPPSTWEPVPREQLRLLDE